MQFNFIKAARQLTNIAIKNSEIVQPYVKSSHYRRGLLALNALYYALRIADKDK
ncbi:MAG: hypothetical protein J7J29_08435 [Psychrobacter sp.]|nr:hypothetical protein [Psychrobacter sp.]